jgi:hypothetical protein
MADMGFERSARVKRKKEEIGSEGLGQESFIYTMAKMNRDNAFTPSRLMSFPSTPFTRKWGTAFSRCWPVSCRVAATTMWSRDFGFSK